ncbi:MAG: SRPBCC domain-containing protein [Chloroflexota bacterium]
MARQYGNISNEALEKATGKTWEEWIALLDEEGALELSHKEIAALLLDRGHIETGNEWWAQSVTVGYEYAKGRRVKGETADAGFQVGVQRTIGVEADRLWDFLTGPQGLPLWLGHGVEDLAFTEGERYETDDGARGEIRSVYPPGRLRLTWQPAGWENQSTLQLYLQDKGDRTALRFHHEKLRDADQRSEMKAHWTEVLERIKALL